MRIRTAFLAAFAAALLGCNSPITSAACPDDLRVERAPADTVIRVGQSFTPHFRFLGCGGTMALDDVLTFSSTNADVLSVNASSGRATGIAPGEAHIRMRGAKYGETGARIEVTVIP